jgi:hypothetical protein
MEIHFDAPTFFHALYVAFAYSWLAFGATAYRQVIDNFSIKESRLVKMGEDIAYAYDPLMMVWIASFVGLAVLSALVAFVWVQNPHIELYCVPLGFLINIVQLRYRMSQQRLRIRTFGLIGRNIFEEGMRAIAYERVHLVEVERDPVWNVVTIYYTEENDIEGKNVKIFRRRILRNSMERLVTTLRQKTSAKIFMKDETALGAPTEE